MSQGRSAEERAERTLATACQVGDLWGLMRSVCRLLLAALVLAVPLGFTGCGAVVSKSSTMQMQMAIYTPLCLEIKAGSTLEGEIVQTYPCVPGERRQEWTFLPIPGTTSSFHIVNANSLQCMTVSYGRSALGTPVVQAPCYVPSQASQVWAYIPATDPKMGYTLVSAINNLCLDIPYGETTGETPMQIFTCKAADPAQAYVLNPVAQGSTP